MEKYDRIGLKVASIEFEQFMNDATKYHITNFYLSNLDISIESNMEKVRLINIGGGIIIEFNNSIMYEFGSGMGVCDYHLKFSKPIKFPISENYLSVKHSEIIKLKQFIGKSPCWIIPTTCHREQTVLMTLEIRNYDKTKFKLIGTPFKTLIGNKMIQHYDGAWILTENSEIDNANLL